MIMLAGKPPRSTRTHSTRAVAYVQKKGSMRGITVGHAAPRAHDFPSAVACAGGGVELPADATGGGRGNKRQRVSNVMQNPLARSRLANPCES